MNSPAINYTALGDSLSFGIGAPLFQGYARILGNYIRCVTPFAKVRNISKILATSGDLLFQVRSNIGVRNLISHSNLITISTGGNNLLNGIKNRYTVFNEAIVQQGVIYFASDWPLILHEIRNSIGFNGSIYIMNLYNPCRYDDPRYQLFKNYIHAINSTIASRELINNFCYEMVDVYSLFQSNPSKDWTNFYHVFSNIHPTAEGHRQLFLLHKSVIGI